MTNLNSQDLAKYTASQVASLADVDVYAVRAEGERRQLLALKRIASLKKQLLAAQTDLAGSELILCTVFGELAK